jgi:hypothetical protein
MNGELPEKHESLWMLAVSPLIWATHFLLCYCTAALWCAKVAGPGGPLAIVRWAIAVYTLLALAGVLVVGFRGLRRLDLSDAAREHDFDTRHDRHRFLGFASLLLAGLSALAIVYAALAAVFIESCH